MSATARSVLVISVYVELINSERGGIADNLKNAARLFVYSVTNGIIFSFLISFCGAYAETDVFLN